MYKVGDSVKIRPVYQESAEFHGRVGTLAKIDEHASDGDAFGVKFDGDALVYYFWLKELERGPGAQRVRSILTPKRQWEDW